LGCSIAASICVMAARGAPFIIAGVLSGRNHLRFRLVHARAHGNARALWKRRSWFRGFSCTLRSRSLNRRAIKTPEMLEKFLPLAMALGWKNWSKAVFTIFIPAAKLVIKAAVSAAPPPPKRGMPPPPCFAYGFDNNLTPCLLNGRNGFRFALHAVRGGAGFSGGGGSSGGRLRRQSVAAASNHKQQAFDDVV